MPIAFACAVFLKVAKRAEEILAAKSGFAAKKLFKITQHLRVG